MFKNGKPLNMLYWLLVGIFTILFIYLLVKLFPVYRTVFSFLWHLFAPFMLAALIAYLLYPLVKMMHLGHIPKGLSILLIYIVFFGGTGYGLYCVYPLLIQQIHEFGEQLPAFIKMYQQLIDHLYDSTSFLPETVHNKMDMIINGMEGKMEKLTGKMVGGVTKLFDLIVFLTVIPVLVFYFLNDWQKIKDYIKRWIPVKYHKKCHRFMVSMDKGLGGYIRGQIIVCAFVGIATYIVFMILHIKYALVLAIIMGITNIIPYFGPIIGMVPAIAIALTTSVKLVVMVLIAVFAIQLIESNLLSPYIVGKSVHIHPIAIIFALLLGGEMGNVVGMIIAVPVMTIFKVLVQELIMVK